MDALLNNLDIKNIKTTIKGGEKNKIKKTKKTTFLSAKTAVRCYSYTFMTGPKKM